MMEERRKYFRIDDLLGLSFSLLGAEEAKLFVEEVKQNNGAIDYAANFDNRIHTLLDACKVQSPLAAELLDLLNKKLNFIVSQFDVDQHASPAVDYQMTEVNISACGMGFVEARLLQAGQILKLDLRLSPEELTIVTLAKVVACEALDGGLYFLRLSFPQISTTDQELLIQHVVKKQSAQLRQRRRESELAAPQL
jgi:hypothetical protein